MHAYFFVTKYSFCFAKYCANHKSPEYYFHRYLWWQCWNSICYSLFYLSELSAKKCSVGTLRKEQYMSSITKLGKNVVQCCREHGAVYVVCLANCRLVVELVLMRAPMRLWLQVAQELLNVKMLIFSVRKWCIRPFSVSRRCHRKSI